MTDLINQQPSKNPLSDICIEVEYNGGRPIASCTCNQKPFFRSPITCKLPKKPANTEHDALERWRLKTEAAIVRSIKKSFDNGIYRVTRIEIGGIA